MTHVVERITVRTSVDLIDAIGKPVTSSITMHIRGGGLFHAVVVTDGKGNQTAIYWERNENRFRTLDLDERDILNAEREWNLPERRSNVSTHNIMCSCSECQRKAFAPTVASPPQEEIVFDEPHVGVPGAPAPAPAPEARFPIADMQMQLAALAERVVVLEAEVAALRLRDAARTV